MTCAVLAAAGLLTGCGTSTEPDPAAPSALDTTSVVAFPGETFPHTSGPRAFSPIETWRQNNASRFNDIGDAMLATRRALEERGAPQLPDACRRMSESAGRLRDTLPTPDPELTTALSTLVDTVSGAAAQCPGTGATSAPAGFVSAMRTAQTQYEAAQRILAGRA